MNREVLPDYTPLADSIAVGSVYEHYKGLRYKILGIGRHSETLEEVVVYQALYGDKNIWVRPVAMFLEDVTINGKPGPRFTLIS